MTSPTDYPYLLFAFPFICMGIGYGIAWWYMRHGR
jgi:hypothetical protein